MKKAFLILIVMIGCTIEVPVDEIEVPPIENHTRIVVNIPDGLSVPQTSTPSDGEGEASDAHCVYKHFPDYYSKYGAYVVGGRPLVHMGGGTPQPLSAGRDKTSDRSGLFVSASCRGSSLYSGSEELWEGATKT